MKHANPSTRPAARRRHGVPALFGALLLAGAAIAGVRAQDGEDASALIDQSRTALEKWVETERLISQERRDLGIGKDMLEARIELMRGEIDALREKTAEAGADVTEADKKRGELLDERDRLVEASRTLEGLLASLEDGVRDLLPRLADPIRERIKPLSQKLPADDAETTISLSKRFGNVVGMLNEINKFSQEITLASEVRELSDGTSAQVDTLYLGVSQAFYVDAKRRYAGTGTVTEAGWVWKPADASAPQIAEIIAILEGDKPAAFVAAPVEIH